MYFPVTTENRRVQTGKKKSQLKITYTTKSKNHKVRFTPVLQNEQTLLFPSTWFTWVFSFTGHVHFWTDSSLKTPNTENPQINGPWGSKMG